MNENLLSRLAGRTWTSQANCTYRAVIAPAKVGVIGPAYDRYHPTIREFLSIASSLTLTCDDRDHFQTEPIVIAPPALDAKGGLTAPITETGTPLIGQTLGLSCLFLDAGQGTSLAVSIKHGAVLHFTHERTGITATLVAKDLPSWLEHWLLVDSIDEFTPQAPTPVTGITVDEYEDRVGLTRTDGPLPRIPRFRIYHLYQVGHRVEKLPAKAKKLDRALAWFAQGR